MSEFEPSKLGTKEHWDTVYAEELTNFEELGDEGEVWFGQDSVDKMVEWTLEHLPASQNASILEIGSGNGTLLFSLIEAGYSPARLSGIDYSAGAVKLAQSIASTRSSDGIAFYVCDFLSEDPPTLLDDSSASSNPWDLLLDKGTYDAIALGARDSTTGSSPVDEYPRRVEKLLSPKGFFLITSCNFTEDELKAAFENGSTSLRYHSRIDHPKLTFGGKEGSTCSSVAFINSK